MARVAIYARVSTTDKGQDPENQLLQLRDHRVGLAPHPRQHRSGVGAAAGHRWNPLGNGNEYVSSMRANRLGDTNASNGEPIQHSATS